MSLLLKYASGLPQICESDGKKFFLGK